MILPTKHLKTSSSLIWAGAVLLQKLNKPKSVGLLWEEVKNDAYVKNYQKYILTLDLLYLLSMIELKEGLITVIRK